MKPDHPTIMESIGVALPSLSVTTGDLLDGCSNQIKFPLESITGIKTRRVGGTGNFSIDLAKKAIDECLAKSKYKPCDIELLICCNISRYDDVGLLTFEPNTSIKLRKHFDFKHAMVFDITNACAGMFTAIYIANAFIKSGVIQRGLVVSGEYITHLSVTAQQEIDGFMDARLACLTLGDSGAAVILERAADTTRGFQALDLQTFGSYSHYCVAKASKNGGMIMYTDPVKLTEVALKSCASHTMATLENAGWPAESFQHLIMHQTSRMTLNGAMREINRLQDKTICRKDNTIDNLEQRGNTASTSHFIALVDHIRNGNINSGDKIVFSVSASGLTIGTGLYVFDDLPDRFRTMELQHSFPEKISVDRSLQPTNGLMPPRIRMESVGIIPEGTSPTNGSMDLLQLAAKDCLRKSSYQCRDVDLLIYAGVYRDEYLLEPAYAALLAGELNMNGTSPGTKNQKTLAFDIFNGSLGFLNACYVAQQMMGAGDCGVVMVVAAESENKTGAFPNEVVGVREAGSAILLDVHPAAAVGFSRFVFHYHVQSIDAYISNYRPLHQTPHLEVTKDPDLERLYIGYILPAVEELLRLEGLGLSDIATIFPPQISAGFITCLSGALALPRNKFIDVVGNGPDLFSSSLPYAFGQACSKGVAKNGDIALVIAVGSGIQIGCAVYYF